MNIINRIKCRLNGGHNYTPTKFIMTNAGMGKMFVNNCECGSEKVTFV